MIETSCGLPGNVLQHKLICEYLNDLYARKNADYGDSFHLTFMEEGWAMPRIRLSDKLNRFKALTFAAEEAKVKDESVRDTLIDLANYAIMSVMELDRLTAEAEEEKPKKELMLKVIEHADGSLTCPLCGEEIVCNVYGDMPDYCQACGIKLKYPEVSV